MADQLHCCTVTFTNKEIVHSRLHPEAKSNNVYLLFFIITQNLAGIDAAVSAVTLSPLGNTRRTMEIIM